MRLIGLAVVLAVGLTLAPLAVAAQPAGKMYAVGILGEKASDPSEARMWQTFQLGLRELGWIEGRNIRIESRWLRTTTLGSQSSRRTWFGSGWT